MKKVIALLTLVIGSTISVCAQVDEFVRRGRVMNVTDTTSQAESHHRRIGSRASAPLPCTGSPKVPIVLVQFSDLSFSSGNTDEEVLGIFQKHFNGSGIPGERYEVDGGSWGSVSDYFIEQSDSIFQPEFTVIGPVTLSQEYAYYGKNSGSSKDVNISQFYNEACQLAVANYDVDWSNFDNNEDGKVDFVFFIYAGYGENDAKHDDPNTIWPHESVSPLSVAVDDMRYVFAAYGCCNEIYNGRLDGIGTICHELSHGLGLPDLYDYNYTAFGMDLLDVMDYGNYQDIGLMPCCYSGYERDFMGWREMVEIDADSNVTLVIEPIEAGGKAYKIVNPANENEYFVLENRQNIGFDTYYGLTSKKRLEKYGTCHGLLITHIDYSPSAWSSNKVNYLLSHQRCTPVPADGELNNGEHDEKYYTSLRTDLYPAGGTEMSSYAVFTGDSINTRIWNIKENEDLTVTVTINNGSAESDDDPSEGGEDIPDGIISASHNARAEAIYSIDGARLKHMHRGMNLVRMNDGSVKKHFVK